MKGRDHRRRRVRLGRFGVKDAGSATLAANTRRTSGAWVIGSFLVLGFSTLALVFLIGTRQLGAAYIAMAALGVAVPLAWLVLPHAIGAEPRWFIMRMLEAGRCPACAYPLRGLVAEADGCVVCPECGGAWKVGFVEAGGVTRD